MKVVTVVGTRPEIIRLSRVIPLLDHHIEHVLIHTGQNYDPRLSDVFFDEMKIRRPDRVLGVSRASFGAAVGEVISGVEILLRELKPDALLVLGDTNSAMAAYPAKRLHVPIFHCEAGNRARDFDVPEEVNRRVVDVLSDYNLVYTEHARRNLLTEGYPADRIFLVGSPMKEVYEHYSPDIGRSKVLKGLGFPPRGYIVASFHREENVDRLERQAELIGTLHLVREEFGLPIVLSVHPRTRVRMGEALAGVPGVTLCEPFGFFDYVHLQRNAACVLSDSGSLSEEAAIVGFPAVSVRRSSERPEAEDSGTVVLSGTRPTDVIRCVKVAITASTRGTSIPHEYVIDDTSRRVLRLIVGHAKMSNSRWGVSEPW